MVNWKNIDRLAKAHFLTDPVYSETSLRRFLEMWWCFKYSRPFKDPLLREYSLDELCYEYLIHFYVENDPKKDINQKKMEKEEEEWARQMMSKVQASNQKAKEKKEQEKAQVQALEKSFEVPDLPEISTKFDE